MMKHTIRLAAAVLAIATTLGAAEAAKPEPKPTVYTKYVDWQWVPKTIQDNDSANNVRNQMDFTVPIHGPWLTNPMPDGMTVTWITRVKCAGGIEYREKGTEEFKRLWFVKYGQIDYSKDLHSFHLTGLKPGTEYEYRLLSNMDNYSTAYHGVLAVGREIYSFKTLDPKKDKYKVMLTADFHGTARLSLDPLYKGIDGDNCDMFFFLGDIVEDGPYRDIRYYTTFGFLDDITRVWGKYKPSIFIRGNHDINGRDTYKWGDYFPQPNERTYQAFRQGPVLFICIDTMWFSSTKLQNEQHMKYLQEQVDWIKALKKTKDWKEAKFRVVLGHVAPYSGEGDKLVGTYFNEVFSDDSKNGRIHAYLCGHEHAYWRINARSGETRYQKGLDLSKVKRLFGNTWKEGHPVKAPYTLVVLHLVEGMTLEVSPEKLIFKSHNWHSVTPDLYDAFEIYPDGSVKDLIEVPVRPIVFPAKKAK